jgi:hypothetical protein
MSESTSTNKGKLIAFRLNSKVAPTFEDLAIQAHQAGLIKHADVNRLAKFSLNFFAEIWLRQQANITRTQQKQYGNPRDPLRMGQDANQNQMNTMSYGGSY